MVYNSKEGRLFLLDGGKEDLVVINSKAGRLPVFLDSFDSVGMEDDGSALIWALPRRGRVD